MLSLNLVQLLTPISPKNRQLCKAVLPPFLDSPRMRPHMRPYTHLFLLSFLLLMVLVVSAGCRTSRHLRTIQAQNHHHATTKDTVSSSIYSHDFVSDNIELSIFPIHPSSQIIHDTLDTVVREDAPRGCYSVPVAVRLRLAHDATTTQHAEATTTHTLNTTDSTSGKITETVAPAAGFSDHPAITLFQRIVYCLAIIGVVSILLIAARIARRL